MSASALATAQVTAEANDRVTAITIVTSGLTAEGRDRAAADASLDAKFTQKIAI